MNQPLIFDIAMGHTKPENIRNRTAPCPFCDTLRLTDILETKGPIIWLMNKYPVLQHTWQTVIIETESENHTEFSKLPLQKAIEILSFSIEKWKEVIASNRFASVLLFKNFGPMSGGSIYHPHSQIVGLEEYDYRADITIDHFQGWHIYEDSNFTLKLAKQPIVGFFEFSLTVSPRANLSSLTQCIQQILDYILTGFSKHSQSYNIFFYDLHTDEYYIKIVPRYITSPLSVGYSIPQTCNDERAHQICTELRSLLV